MIQINLFVPNSGVFFKKLFRNQTAPDLWQIVGVYPLLRWKTFILIRFHPVPTKNVKTLEPINCIRLFRGTSKYWGLWQVIEWNELCFCDLRVAIRELRFENCAIRELDFFGKVCLFWAIREFIAIREFGFFGKFACFERFENLVAIRAIRGFDFFGKVCLFYVIREF